ncbi:histidine kinase [Brevibacillus sp. SYP-B805]|uniref:DUF294 nucleotidyltransferase-like domain-containing protein n=1 Tax=Brevibacillus sp. SYP-B805 TaxID=1578199 RepID=UPI0013EA778D|nr:histidine kinase [Brevibacillus sp. SYP-B805]
MPLHTLHNPLHDALQRVSNATTVGELSRLHREAFAPASYASSGVPAGLTPLINQLHDRLIIQTIRCCLAEMKAAGMGDPPVPYAFLLFGSGGRREQSLASDQDNGMVYRLPPEASQREQEEIAAYFRRFGQLVVTKLSEVGYPPCQGNVLASNSRWNRSLQDWDTMFREWNETPTWENIRYLLVTGDGRLLLGDDQLFARWKADYHQLLADNPPLIARCVSNTLRHRVPLGLFGRIITEVNGKFRGGIHLKNGLYLPYVNCVRLWSLANGITATGTLERIDAIRSMHLWEEELCETVQRHFHRIADLRLLAATQWQDDLYESSSYLQLAKLPRETIGMVRQAMKVALYLQKITSRYEGDR